MKSTKLEDAKEQLGLLSQADRAELAYYLLTSLEPDQVQAEEDLEARLLRRLEEIQSGAVEGVPWEEALTELEALDKG